MRVRCKRDDTEFEAEPTSYPTGAVIRSTFYRATGDFCIDCPTCGRRYFLHDDREEHEEARGKWYSDRELEVLEP